jgi:LysM repeat protein
VLPETSAVESVQPAVEPVAAAPAQNFVDDLNALTKASEQAVEVAAAPAPEISAPAFLEVRVKKGDVLEKIARSHHTSVQEIMKANRLSSTSLKIGQVLKVPGKTAIVKASQPKAQVQQASNDSSFKYYTVKSGDNPWTIAVKNHIKVEDLLRLNNMDEAKARKLKPGDQIRIR